MLGWLCFTFNVASAVAAVGVLVLLVRKARVQPSPGNLVTAAEHYRRLNRQIALLCYGALFLQALRVVAESTT
ncbi:hypothetical protein SAMN02745126_06391 [Enhydrobacter aerosaccus]|uniref:Uncharacterized protein n=1 Tax=Enhydrobacter aerosaccus TaxID=225324 RepID=A0A1T4TJP6_9HYPH|nr:hypothetical protein [Enhydrobacter aerosaccus]SKA40624.1 hypothetical protein SAMN02745126_06391 [Enhydrobacter aerosaccus]